MVGTGNDGQEADITGTPTPGQSHGPLLALDFQGGSNSNLPSRHFREIKVGTFTGAVS